MRFILFLIVSACVAFLTSCGSGLEYQEPNYEIKELPIPVVVVDVAQPDFDVPSESVVSQDVAIPNIGSPNRPLVLVIPTAKVVPGRPGCVINPYNQNIVDVVGIPSGAKVVDPLDDDKTHVFKIP